jgi:hypothetical protein
MPSRSTETTPSADTALPRGFAYCSWHEGYAWGARLVRIHEQGSGGGGKQFACPPCRTAYDLTPIADQP